MTPTIGRIVHWYDPERNLGPYAAIIVAVVPACAAHCGWAELQLFAPTDAPGHEMHNRKVVHVDDQKTEGPYWCWPPRGGV